MKDRLKEIDAIIKESLTREEAEFYDSLEEQNTFEMMGGLFRGKNRWLLIIMNIIVLVALGFLVWSIVQFLNAETAAGMVRWAALGFVCFGMIGMLKIYAWMQMDKNAVLRELKRLELQISSLANKEVTR